VRGDKRGLLPREDDGGERVPFHGENKAEALVLPEKIYLG